ncbi:hypothetical protein ACQPW1_36255 [Nocardia sp. CA-128927]|uniref:restriction system modified-DNA reader domain-containing protein n=1 Tax=Nocardia sp. CA-128927 TaxID=3239975 RepID=UPI003D963BE6
MGRSIEIDDEVYQALGHRVRGFESPNDVLRRLLIPNKSDIAPGDTAGPAKSQTGRLAPLISSNLVKSGDELRHERVRKGQTFVATVTPDGLIQTEKGVYVAPSPALRDLVGSQIDGWQNWVHTPSGMTLRQLRSSL